MERRRTATRGAVERLGRWGLRLAAGLAGLGLLMVLPFRWIDPPFSSVMLQQWFAALRTDRRSPAVGAWTDWGDIPPEMAMAVIAAEDQKFPDHWGFDFGAIAEALDDRLEGGRLRGASTITQQVAKNLYLWQGRHWLRKGFEACFTLLIEALWPKRRILEVYLNIAEFGDGVYGVGAASRRFFEKTPGRLTLSECCRLAAVLPSPKRMDPARPSRHVRDRAVWIQRQIRLMGGAAVLDRLRN